eukprot:CAMPEP_0204110500 /NCGR_PEP_ID=MMETSP0361-20130328/1921_1 /ASSEMBLY_ACC=CAM_ASM_000343 /TAXON_ID=268821 /ORGANISM="Scrippsiella Hangoei, Strain SHTV-5" /LENGTH=56 /DNA_ID=CAMNT_0051060417 /DNA_START=332 /DNA_END=498 /DNA_ORIENTATION=+
MTRPCPFGNVKQLQIVLDAKSRRATDKSRTTATQGETCPRVEAQVRNHGRQKRTPA